MKFSIFPRVIPQDFPSPTPPLSQSLGHILCAPHYPLILAVTKFYNFNTYIGLYFSSQSSILFIIDLERGNLFTIIALLKPITRSKSLCISPISFYS